MNKVLKGLLVAVLTVSSVQVNADTNKTFLMPRATGVDLPMEYSTFSELIHRKAEDAFGGNLQVTGFYKDSNSGKDLAEYFLFKDKSTIKLAADVAGNIKSTVTNDFDLAYIIHNVAAVADNDIGSISLDPEQDSYGVRFDYYQDLSKILKGLYLYANLPVVHVENDPNLKVNIKEPFGGAQGVAVLAPAAQTNLINFFKGNYDGDAANGNAQEKLKYAKIDGKQSSTGVADIDLGLGYKFLNKESYHAALAIAVTIPTGNEADGEYMFEPIHGNGHHFGLGGDLNGSVRVWGDVDHNLKLDLVAKYRYLFESSEKRTAGINNRNFGQYHLLGKVSTVVGTGFIPAANVTTLNYDVTPGSQFDGILGLAYNNGGFAFNVGYNLYFKETESVKLKDKLTDGQYLIAARSLASTALFDGATNAQLDGAAVATARVNNDQLDLEAAETGSQCTHSIYGGFGYIFREWDTPLMLGIGGKYEWASKNTALDQWGVWLKAGIGF